MNTDGEYNLSANADRQARDHFRLPIIRECIKPELLESMCMMGQIEETDDVQSITDQMVQTWYEGLIEVDPSDLNYRLNKIMKDEIHSPDRKDPGGSVVDYVHEIVTHIRRLGMGNIMADERQGRQVVSKMVNGLKPGELKEHMIRERVMWPEEKDGKIKYFIERAKQLAREVRANIDYKTGISSLKNNTNSRGYGLKTGNTNNNKHRSESEKRKSQKLY